MKKILECKVSLMEKDINFSIDEESKGNYIIRTSGTFNPEKVLEDRTNKFIITEDEYKSFVETAIMTIYEDLLENSTDKKVDTVGIWITFEDGEKIDNAMDISLLEAIEDYGEEGVISILELAKMTLAPYYESEVSS
jgi:hypothetical protein